MLRVTNPANGSTIAELATDSPQTAAAKYHSARAVQPSWAGRPVEQRLACIRRFRDGIVSHLDRLAAILTS
jgi:acyl-CoA reductase-like NAD-dependent aldehyde dehydrogenase